MVTIDQNGKVISSTAEGSYPLLRAASEAAAKEWSFSPGKSNVERNVRLTFVYTFKEISNQKNNYKETVYKTKFKKPYTLEIIVTAYPQFIV